ncbi:porphyrin biosynthesis protein [Klebsiella pneumoniae]|uniref:Porphyrin biosynthetic protein n=4 Tax=Klebsiella pneumoniae TaxID=573 RepID=A0A0H3H0M2_KLEPH|nr:MULTISPECIES: porphyrin biosynthesis protein [Klebsiella]YP_005220824.1 porphyrin biosynthetic protein [Klebsiella pneumoniae subsp. pneumoniae HS11286]UMX52378.1 porphyrin biosynthesis protein [Escherichia coli]AEW91925.1 porphyrin biosynthetic protein [Klebsiella pneumoniae subsp. pneumoniae HS11286]ASC26350.1 porphyrin biosynthesis protein [Klebsiella pneumoniae]ASK04253.1 Aerobic cobaltochelatase subunit CobT [Klebsiella pneumoniae]AUH88367.1 porphyrin biosynthesis protein [Klebsiella 
MATKPSKTVLKEVQDFRDSVKRVVGLLSGKNIPVAECGDTAYVRYNKKGEPVMVNIPSIPDDASPALMNAIRGFLDHEVGHLLFTDEKVVKKMRNTKAFGLWNALEDVYIERRMSEVFTGSRRNLLSTRNLMIDKYFNPHVKKAVAMCRGDQRELFLKFFLCPVLRAWDGQPTFADFMEEHWHLIDKPIAVLKEFGVDEAVRRMDSTEDCVKVAAAMAKILREMTEMPEGPLPERESSLTKKTEPEEDSSDEPAAGDDTEVCDEEGLDSTPDEFSSDDEDDEKSDKSISKYIPNNDKVINDTESKPEDGDLGHENVDDLPDSEETTADDPVTSLGSDAGEEVDDEGDYSPSTNDSAKDRPGSSSDDSEAVEDGEGEGKADKDGGEEKDEGDRDTSDESDAGFAPHADDMSLDDALKALENVDEEIGSSTEDALASAIKSELASASLSDYRPYNRSYDFLGPIDEAEEHIKRARKAFGAIPMYSPVDRYRIVPEGRKLFEMKVERHLSSSVSSTLAKDLERAIASRNRVQFIPGQRRGRVHGASLYRLSMNDDRVFRRKEDHKAVNACVQQVIDLSGSMGGRKIELALASAYTLADALDRIHVPNVITGFTTYGNPDVATMSKRGFSRFEALMLPIIKNWHEKANSPEIRARMGCVAETFPLLNNVDGESIAQLASLFAGRMEDKKIMIVQSDGAPCAAGDGFSNHLRSVTNDIENTSDINLLAIGILTDAPRRYYKNYALVNKVEELGTSVVSELSRIILE